MKRGFALLAATAALLTGCGVRQSTTTAAAMPRMPETYVFTREAFPRLDGSAAAVPMAQAAASVLLGEDREAVTDLVQFHKTERAYWELLEGSAQVLLAADPGIRILAEKGDNNWETAPFAMDALAFFVNESNGVDSLTIEELRGIYAGEITNWSQVGGADLDIAAFQRSEGSGSQTAMETLVMGDTPMMAPPAGGVHGEMGDLIRAAASYENSAGAIGYGSWYALSVMGLGEGVKILSVNGAAPDRDSIRTGQYPACFPYYAVISAETPEEDPARIFFDWIQGPEGQKLAEQEGYVSAEEMGGAL